ncbi:MAG: hypothetical protein ABIQ27_04245 [Flavobacterium sp.]|uniref:hypothetical protein n=1 Tax=Flavobacterium sp. TaxID=239 RepID=UPI003266002B
MKKIISLIFLTSLVLNACSSDSDSPFTPENDALVKRITVTDDGTFYTDFFYNGKKIVKQIPQSSNPKYYTYTDDFITRIDTYDSDGMEIVGFETFTYDTSGRLLVYLQNVEPDNPVTFEHKIDFTYNTDNTVSCLWHGGFSGIFTDILGAAVIHLTDNEISSVDITPYSDGTDPGEPYTVLYNYDNNNNPFKNIIGFSQLNLVDAAEGESYGEVFGVDHNILTNGWFTADSSGTSSTTTYTYNSLSFPETSVKIMEGGPYPSTTTTYIYY